MAGSKQRKSVRATLLITALGGLKHATRWMYVSPPRTRRITRWIEHIVPGPPRKTQTKTLDAGGVSAVRISVPKARDGIYVLYFHGGGYALGSAPLFRDFTWRIGAAACAHVLYFDYRLAPEHPFPAALDDAVRVYRWLSTQRDVRKVAFGGESSGGGLLLGTLLKLRDDGVRLPNAAVALSPWTDLALTGTSLQCNARTDPVLSAEALPSLAKQYLAGTDPRNPYASPLYGNAFGLPPLLIQAGSREILRDDAVRIAENYKPAGCEVEIEIWEDMPHTWHLYARILPEGRDAIDRIGTFLRQRLR